MADPIDPAAAVRVMIEQWLTLSNAVAAGTLGGTPRPLDLAASAATLLGAINMPTRAEVVAIAAAVAEIDARLARIEALLERNAGAARSPRFATRSSMMADLSQITEHMNVIGADGVHVGTVDGVEGGRIKLTKDSSTHTDHHHYISGGLVAGVEGNDVRLSANGDVAVTFEEES